MKPTLIGQSRSNRPKNKKKSQFFWCVQAIYIGGASLNMHITHTTHRKGGERKRGERERRNKKRVEEEGKEGGEGGMRD